MKTKIFAIFVGLSIGSLVAWAGNIPMQYDSTTGQAYPSQIPPTRVQYPNGAVKTQYATGTNTVVQTDLATTTPTANAIPMALPSGKLDSAWLPFSSGTFYFDDVASDISTYYVLRDGPGSGAEVTDSVSITSASGETLIEAYATATGVPGSSIWQGGNYSFNIWRQVSNVAGSSRIVFRVYRRATGGTETELFNATTAEINDTSLTYEEVVSVQPDFSVLTSDRMIVKVFATTTSGASITVGFAHNGTTRYSHVHTPMTYGSSGGGAANSISCSGCYLSGTSTATTLAISQNPEIIVTPVTVGSPPTSRTVCGHALSADVTCTPSDVGALPASSVSGTQNYHARFGATGATLENGVITDDGTAASIAGSYASEVAVDLLKLNNTSGDTTNNGASLGIYQGATRRGRMSGFYLAELNRWVLSLGSTVAHGIILDGVDLSLGYGTGGGGVIVWQNTDKTNGIALRQTGSNTGLVRLGMGYFLHYDTSTGDVVTNAPYSGGGSIVFQHNGTTVGQFERSTGNLRLNQALVLNGSTSGSITQRAPAAATQCTSGQSLRFADGVGTVGCFSPMVADGASGLDCTSINALNGKVVGCSTTAHVPASRTITFPYSTKSLTANITATVTDLSTATPGNTNSIPNSGATGYLNPWVTNTVHTTDTRLSNARTPTAHASTHVTGGGDVIPDAVSSGASGLMTGTQAWKLGGIQNYAVALNSSSTPSALSPGTSGSAGNGTTSAPWNHTHAISLGGQVLISSTTFTDGGLTTTPSGAWQNLVSHTFTTTGTRFRVYVEAVYGDVYPDKRMCAIGIMADAGGTASTRRGLGDFEIFQTADANAYNNVFSSMYMLGTARHNASFTLAAGTVTVAIAGYSVGGGNNCYIPGSAATMIVDVYQ